MKVLHIIMLSLSVIGTISLFIIPSVTTKIIIGIILLAYTFTLLSKYSNIKNILKISSSSSNSFII
jgi:hypothetical protein